MLVDGLCPTCEDMAISTLRTCSFLKDRESLRQLPAPVLLLPGKQMEVRIVQRLMSQLSKLPWGLSFSLKQMLKWRPFFFPGSQKHWAWVNSFTLSWILAARWFVSGRWAWRYVAFSPSAFLPESTWGIDKSWKALFWARKGYTNSSVLTTLDGGPARGYVEVSQLERAIAVHLCSLNIAIWRGHPRLSSRAYSYGFIHQPPGWCSLPSEM